MQIDYHVTTDLNEDVYLFLNSKCVYHLWHTNITDITKILLDNFQPVPRTEAEADEKAESVFTHWYYTDMSFETVEGEGVQEFENLCNDDSNMIIDVFWGELKRRLHEGAHMVCRWVGNEIK